MIKRQYIERFVLGAYTICLPWFAYNTVTNESANYCILVLAALSALLLAITGKPQKITITLTDILFLTFFLWAFLDSFVLNSRVLSNERLALILASFFVFLLPKFTFAWTEKTLAVLLASGGVWQAVVSWLQYGEVLSSNHSEFPVTGNFANPAHLGAYLGLAMLCTGYLLYSCYRQKRYMLCICLSAGLLAMGGIFLLAFSRASWVALVVVLLLGAWKGNRLKIRIFLCFFLLSSIVWLPSLYRVKQASADGRLFIWRVSTDMIKSAPLQGRGGDAFAANYMLAQADFLKSHADVGYEAAATDNTRAFNEFLRIAYEYGIIGLLLVIVLFYSAFRSSAGVLVKFILVYLCVFACFSYPAEVPVFLLLCSILLGFSSCKTDVRGVYGQVGRKVVVCFCAVAALSTACCLSTKKYNRMDVLQRAYQSYHSENYADALSHLQQAYTLCPVSEICMDLGNCHFYLGDYKEAEFYLTQARWMVPSHILPRYYLFRLYVVQNDTERIQVIGDEILNGKFQKEGSVAVEVRHYVRNYFNECERRSSNSDN